MPSWVVELQEHLHYYAYGGIEEDQKEINGCLGMLASNLLETKYAIKREESNAIQNWWILYITLATPTPEEVRGNTFMIATHAAGWSGIVASRLAPTLSNRYYLSFSILMIVTGFFHDFYVARNTINPISLGLANVRGMLREFRKPQKPGAQKAKIEP